MNTFYQIRDHTAIDLTKVVRITKYRGFWWDDEKGVQKPPSWFERIFGENYYPPGIEIVLTNGSSFQYVTETVEYQERAYKDLLNALNSIGLVISTEGG